jgi:hypothetical protein
MYNHGTDLAMYNRRTNPLSCYHGTDLALYNHRANPLMYNHYPRIPATEERMQLNQVAENALSFELAPFFHNKFKNPDACFAILRPNQHSYNHKCYETRPNIILQLLSTCSGNSAGNLQ